MSEWADKNRALSSEASAEPGQWSTSRAEYQRAIMDAFNDPLCETVVFMSSSQVGKTEILNNVIGYFIDQDPSPILIVQPTIEMGTAWSKDRLTPMLRDTPALSDLLGDARSRDSSNTIRMKEFTGGRLAVAGANSPASLASRPCRIVLFDEVDRYPASAGAEGDPVSIGKKRTQTFWNRKLGMFSTPTVKKISRIEAEYEMSSKGRYHVPCPTCGGFQILRWGQIKFDRDAKGAAKNVRYICEHCDAELRESDKIRMVRSGEWVHEVPEERRRLGFHINELYSPWSSWENIATSFLEAKKRPETLRVWINTVLGESWEEEGESVDAEGLAKRKERYGPELPEGILLLTCGVDVQMDRIEASVWGWGRKEEAWLVRHSVFMGKPQQVLQVWEDLDMFLDLHWLHSNGTTLRIAAAGIDAGYATKRVYDFCRPRQSRRIYATKGQAGAGVPLIRLSKRKDSRTKIKLAILGVDTAKDLLYSRLQIEQFGPGYVHLPMEVDDEWIKQLTAEVAKTRFIRGFPSRYYEKVRARNEALDCFVNALGALASLNVNLDQLADRLKTSTPKKGPPDDKPKGGGMARPRRSGGFVGRF